ncbi:MAG: hypothetical protein D6680_17020 [Cyanobacteria bacterium J007]|nr:MAG: hypothetical protein D6680_17020 [Cyanobacteria bacterium J007]
MSSLPKPLGQPPGLFRFTRGSIAGRDAIAKRCNYSLPQFLLSSSSGQVQATTRSPWVAD